MVKKAQGIGTICRARWVHDDLHWTVKKRKVTQVIGISTCTSAYGYDMKSTTYSSLIDRNIKYTIGKYFLALIFGFHIKHFPIQRALTSMSSPMLSSLDSFSPDSKYRYHLKKMIKLNSQSEFTILSPPI